jgi:amidase
MHPSEEDLASFEPMVAGLLASYDAVENLYAQTAPQPPAGRTWKQPEPAENPLGAWYVKTEIQDAAEGPLAGRRVTVKDNIEVAGVPTINGSRTLAGEVDLAWAVTRAVRCGFPAHGAARWGTSRPMAWSRTPGVPDRVYPRSPGADRPHGGRCGADADRNRGP